MYTFWRGNESSDNESETDSESHFAYFEQDRQAGSRPNSQLPVQHLPRLQPPEAKPPPPRGQATLGHRPSTKVYNDRPDPPPGVGGGRSPGHYLLGHPVWVVWSIEIYLAHGPEYDLDARRYHGLPADSCAAINIGESVATSVMHVIVSGPVPTECPEEYEDHRDSDGDSLSNFGETPTTPSTQPRKEARESERIPNNTQNSNDGAYNNEFVTHDEGATDVGRQPVPPSPEMALMRSATGKD